MQNEAEVIKAAQGGDKAAQAALVDKYTPMAYALAKRGFGADRDDLVQSALVAVLESVHTYDSDKGAFSTHVHWAMRGAITQESRRYTNNPITGLRAADEDGDEKAACEIWAAEEVEPAADVAERRYQAARRVEAALDGLESLDDRTATAVELYLGLADGTPRGYTDIARCLGIAPGSAKYAVDKGLAVMRRA